MNTSRPIRLSSNGLAALRYFEAAARLGSFSRAALELGVTGGAVSHQMKYLESSLGVKLFFRVARQVKLTDEGKRLTESVNRSLKDLDETIAEISNPGQSALKVRLRAGPSFAQRWLTPRLGRLQNRRPDLTLHVIAEYGYFHPVERNFDVAIEFVKGRVAELHTEHLMAEYLVPVCSPKYLTRFRPLRTPADLGRCTLLHAGDAWEGATEDAEWRHWLDAAGGAPEVDSKRGNFFSFSNIAIEAALSDQGVAMGRLSLVQGLLDSGLLIAPFSDRVQTPTSYCLVYPKELATRPAVMEVTRWLHEEAAANQPTQVQAACG